VTDTLPVGEDDLQAYVDGTLSADRAEVVAAYLADHPDVATRVARYTEQRDALRAHLAPKHNEPVPPRLRVTNVIAARKRRRAANLRRIAASLLLLAIGGAAGWELHDVSERAGRTPMSNLTAYAVSAYRTFIVETRHPVEVRANEQTHLRQWLSNRVKHPIVIPDLTAEGFHLLGGRVLPAGDRVAAQIMYQDGHGMRLTVYLQPMRVDVTDIRYTEKDGVSTFYRVEDGLGCAITARTERAKLLRVAQAVYSQFGENDSPTGH
jgi:anti-sigma factor RsiW